MDVCYAHVQRLCDGFASQLRADRLNDTTFSHGVAQFMAQRLRAVDRRLIVILLIVFVQLVGAAMVLPILTIYGKNEFGLSEQTTTLLISSFFAAQFIAGPFIGRLSDRYGRLPVLLISQIGTVISFILLATATSAGMLFFARILDGITGGNIIVAQAYVTDITPKEKRTQALGMIFAAFGLGFIVGPASGGILSAFGPRVPYLFAAIAASIVVLLTWLLLDETLTPEQRAINRTKPSARLNPAQVVGNLPLLAVLLLLFAAQVSFALLQSTLALLGEAVIFAGFDQALAGQGLAAVTALDQVWLFGGFGGIPATLGTGLILAMFGVGQVVTQVFVLRPALRKFGEGLLVMIGSVLRGLAQYGLVLLPMALPAAFCTFFFAIGTGLQVPSLQSLATRTVPDEVRGGVLGWVQSSTSLGIIFGSALGGTLFAIDTHFPYLVGGTILLLIPIPAFFLRRWLNRERDQQRPIPAVQGAA